MLHQAQGRASISFFSLPLLEEKFHLIFPPIQRRGWSSVWLQLTENGVVRLVPHPKLQSQFLILPLTLGTLGSIVRKSEAPRTTRDEKRRAQHNEGRHDLHVKLGAACWDWGPL